MALKNLLTLIVVVFTAAGCVYSQTSSIQQKLEPVADKLMFKPESEIPSFVIFKPELQPIFENFEDWFKNKMGENEAFGLKLLTNETDQIGYTHYRFQQLYNNLPVENTMYLVHVKEGKIVSMNGLLYHHFNIGFNKSITEDAALKKAMIYMNAKIYMWEDPLNEQLIKQQANDVYATWYPKGELVYVANDYIIDATQYKLAYKFDIYATEPLSRQYVFVDAQQAKVIAHLDRIHTSDTLVTAKTAMSGDRQIYTDYYAANSFRLREKNRGNGIETYNMKTGTSYGSAVDFTDSDTTWNNVNSNYDEYATDAHFGAEMTYDYLKNTYNRNSINNSGFKLISYIHYSSSYFNAFWNGSYMTYGDGNGSSIKPLVSLDIAGHEIVHGLTSNTANLTYSYESGALNESFSDCLGSAIEWYGDSDRFEWPLGTKIGWTIRSIGNPKAYSDPNTYKGQYWYTGSGDNGGVHTNSGVQNFWFYLLSTGDSGTNDNGDYYKVDSIGIWKAGAIAYRTLTYYLGTSSQYADARTYSIKAAEDLYGTCSFESFAVAAAWHAVGIGSELSYKTVASLQQNTLSILPGSTNNIILRVAITPACNAIDTVFSFTFNTNGTSNVADIENAKLWYTGTSNTFAATTQYGSTKTSPSGTFTFSGSQKLKKNDDHYFWLTYDIDSNANLGDSVDAECASVTVDTIVTPTITAPAGFRKVSNCFPPTSTSPCSYMYINNVTLDSINNTTGCSSTSYSDYSNLSTIVAQGDQVNYSISLYGYNMYVCIWVDLNNNGIFDSTEIMVQNNLSSGFKATGAFTIPSSTSIGQHSVRVTADYFTTYNSTPCGKLYYGESEDYSIKVDTPQNMYYISSNTTQNTNSVQKSSTNNQVIAMKVVMGGTGNAIPMQAFNINTNGTTDTAEIRNAKVWYTGTNSVYNTTTQFGNTIIYPGDNFTVTDSMVLSKGTNYFWLSYDVASTAKMGNYIDAGCDSITLGNTIYIADTTNPAGNRKIGYCIPPTSISPCTYMYISNVKLDSINKTSTCSSTSYSDFTSNSTTTSQKKSVTYTVSLYAYDQFINIWVDFDDNGIFDSTEQMVKNKQSSSLKDVGSFTIPSSAPIGKHQMRVMADYISFPASYVCSQLYYGETEDYTLNILPAAPTAVILPNSNVSFCIGGGQLFTTGYDSSYKYQWFKNSSTSLSSGKGHPYDSLYYSPSSAGNDTITVKITDVYNQTTTSSKVVVKISPMPVGGTATISSSTICNGNFVNLSSSGSTGTINWQSYNGSAWSNLGSSANPYKAYPTSNTIYRAYISSGSCGNDSSNQLTVTVIPKSVAGSVSPGSASLCVGDSVNLSITGNTGTIKWQYYNNITWQNSGDTTNSFYIIPTTSIIYRALVTSGICGADSSKNISVTVSPKAAGGTAALSASAICAGDSLSLSLANNIGTIAWQYYNNNVWTNMGSSKNPHKFSPSASNIYRAYLSSGACLPDSSNQLTLTVNPKVVAGSISSSATFICASDSVNLILSNNTGTINWQYNTGSAWQSVGLTSNSIYVKPSSNTNYRAYVTAGTCGSDSTKSATIIVTALPVAGTIIASKTAICPGDTSMLSLSGTTGYIIWQSDIGGNWQNIAANSNTRNVFPNATASYRTVVTNGGCGTDTSKIMTIIVNPKAIAGVASAAASSICPGTTTTFTLTGNTGGIDWQYYSNSTWVSMGDTTNTITVPPTAKSNYRAVVSTICSIDSSNIIIVNVFPVAIVTITPGGPKTLCSPDSITLTTNIAKSYIWSTGDTTQKVTIKQTTVLKVSITDLYGCKATSASNVYTFNNPSTPTLSQQGDTLFALPAGAATYTWEYKGSVIKTTPVNYILPTQKGMFAVSLKDSVGCVSQLSGLYNFNFVNIETIYNNKPKIDVWPNPSDGIYNMIAHVGNGSHISLKVTDITGKLLFQENHTTTSGILNTVVDLSKFSHGIYLLYIDTENGMSVPVKLVRE
ncbi:MAG: M4 family metallopeptidase [Bacteroidota bacterium]|nr:M4 family metallopeptidase [Bacteroidota bacterium]